MFILRGSTDYGDRVPERNVRSPTPAMEWCGDVEIWALPSD